MSKQALRDLVPAHGGLSEPVDRGIPLKDRKALLDEAAGLDTIEVTNADLSTVYRLADGALSPLDGPMKQEEFNQVLDSSVIIREGQRYAWTIPMSLPVTSNL